MAEEGGSPGHFTIRAYGAALRFETSDTALLADLREDFSFFISGNDGPCGTAIRASVGEPPAQPAGSRPLFRTAKWSAFSSPSGSRVVSYPEGGLCEFDYSTRNGNVRARTNDLARELSYLLILSLLGEQLDLLGLHRLHAMAAQFGGKSFAAVAPPGGGKTTLLLGLSGEKGFTALANDTPLIDGAGNIYPFPLRIALGGDSPFLKSFPERDLRPFRRRHYPVKYLIPCPQPACAPQPAPCSELFLLKRTSGPPRIAAAAAAGAALELLRSLVIGYGVPQIAEFFLRPGLTDIRAKAGIAMSRASAARALLRCGGIFEFRLSTETGSNVRALGEFLSRRR